MKRQFKALLVLIMIFIIISPARVMANPSEAKLDAVLVIDSSLSMQTNDPKKLGLEAVKMFVDMLGETGNQVGIVTYAKKANKTYPMTQVSTQKDKEAIKKVVDTIDRNLNYTDISQGLTEALKMLEGRKASGNRPLIVVFTDGNNDIRGLNTRTDADIENDLNKVLDSSKKNKYPIYTVGLNARGELNEAYLQNIAAKAGGKAFATNDPADLPAILTEIFADQLDLKVMPLEDLTGTNTFEEVHFNIPNSSVLEANISATSSKPIAFKLVDPKGIEQTIPSSEITVHDSKTYKLLKIKKPMQGDWKLYVKGVKGDNIGIDLVYNYDLEVKINPLSKNTYNIGDALDLEVFLALNGEKVEDETLYNSAKSYVIIKDMLSNNETKVNLVSTGKSFKASYQLKEETQYEMEAVVEDVSFNKKSEKVTFKVEKQGAKVSSPPSQEKKKSSGLGYSIAAVLVGLIGVALFMGYRIFKRTQIPLVGQMIVEVKDNATGKLQPPQYKKLHLFKGKVSLHTLLQFAPEFKVTEQIILKSAPGDKVYLYNYSDYVIEKAGRAVSAKEGLELRKNDKLNVNIAEIGQTVQLEYLL